jgi:hypothetical protein
MACPFLCGAEVIEEGLGMVVQCSVSSELIQKLGPRTGEIGKRESEGWTHAPMTASHVTRY